VTASVVAICAAVYIGMIPGAADPVYRPTLAITAVWLGLRG
jgi:hypothetical protein